VRRGAALVVVGLTLAGCGGDGAEPIVVEFQSQDEARTVGTVRLEEADGGTRIEVAVPDLRSAAHPALRSGQCGELRPRDYELTAFADQRSVTELDVPLERLLERPTAVTVSRRATMPHSIAACAQLPLEGAEPEVALVDLPAGIVWLEADEGRTRVGILLFSRVRGPQPALITAGGCRGEPEHKLNAIRDSESVTTVEAPLETLTDGGHAVLAGAACGEIPADS
jgi:hypothetical protein